MNNRRLDEAVANVKLIPRKELYRLVVDGQFHKPQKGWLGYATREPGCLPAMFSALKVGLTNLNDAAVSPELIKRIHKSASNEVQRINYQTTPGQFRKFYSGFQLSHDEKNKWLNEEGFYEFYNKVNGEYKKYNVAIGIVSAENTSWHLDNLQNSSLAKEDIWRVIVNNQDKVYFRAPNPEVIEKLVEDACKKYNELIASADTDDKKLYAIANFVKEIEFLHSFSDVNGRTSLVLLQRLLIQNGFFPAMLQDPNQIDGYDIKALVENIKIGIKNTEEIIKGDKKSLFDYETVVIEAPAQSFSYEDITRKMCIAEYYKAEQELDHFIQNTLSPTLTVKYDTEQPVQQSKDKSNAAMAEPATAPATQDVRDNKAAVTPNLFSPPPDPWKSKVNAIRSAVDKYRRDPSDSSERAKKGFDVMGQVEKLLTELNEKFPGVTEQDKKAMIDAYKKLTNVVDQMKASRRTSDTFILSTEILTQAAENLKSLESARSSQPEKNIGPHQPY